jgi:hypothetical protein
MKDLIPGVLITLPTTYTGNWDILVVFCQNVDV